MTDILPADAPSATEAAPGGSGAAEPAPAPSRRSRWAFLRSPLFLLGLLLVGSTAARSVWISNPRTVAGDERYYVSAARHMLKLPAADGEFYAGAKAGKDPNAEHPPLGKLVIGTSMRILGDKPIGWRLPSVLFGTLAVGLLYWLARTAGAGSWESLFAATLMAADNLVMVYGRLGTLDIMVVAFMILGVGLYLRRRPLLAGAVLGVGACFKLVGFSALAVVVVIGFLSWAQHRRSVRDPRFPAPVTPHSLAGVVRCLLGAAAVYVGLLALLDQGFTDFPNPVRHTRSMLDYAEITTFQVEAQVRGTFTQGALAPVSRPWQWLVNDGSFSAQGVRAAPVGQPGYERKLVDFQVKISPFVLLLLVPAVAVAAYRSWADSDGPSNVAVAWSVTTFGLLVAVVLRERVGYLYYMLTVLPGVHLAIARLFCRRRLPHLATLAYGGLVMASVVAMYPFRTWGGR